MPDGRPRCPARVYSWPFYSVLIPIGTHRLELYCLPGLPFASTALSDLVLWGVDIGKKAFTKAVNE